MRYSVLEMMGGRTVLAGGIAGRKLLTALITASPPPDGPVAAFLDFARIEVATSSFLRESIVGFRNYARSSLANVYPVAANMEAPVLEEFEFFLRAHSDVFWICRLNTNESISGARLLGDLDPAQRTTFEAVLALGAVTAPALASRFQHLGIGPTAWNNRLSALAAKGLLIEQKVGKTKSFTPLLEMT